VELLLQQHAAEQFPDQNAAETELTPAAATPGEPASHQALKIFHQSQNNCSNCLLSGSCEVSSELDAKLALLV
jgi:hypothetical protein